MGLDDGQTALLPIPLPVVPQMEDEEVWRYLNSLRRSVAENLERLFGRDQISGIRLVDASVNAQNKIVAQSITAAEIDANTITTSEVNFVVVGTDNVITTINTSSEGIRIDADNIHISGSVTFSSGWASQANAESTINVLNTSNAPAEAGADVTGDNTANNTSNVGTVTTVQVQGWAYSANKTYINGGQIYTNTVTADQINVNDVFAEDITCAGEIHSSAKTSYADTDQGWWIGIDSDTKAKLNIGDANNFLKWDGSDIEIKGTKGTLGSVTDYFDITNGELLVSKSGDALTKTQIAGGFIATWENYSSSQYVSTFIGKGYKGAVLTDGTFTRRLFVCGFDGANLPIASGDPTSNIILEINADNRPSPDLQRFKLAVYLNGVAGDAAAIYAENDNTNHYIEHFDIKDCDLDSDCTIDASSLTSGILPNARLNSYIGMIEHDVYQGNGGAGDSTAATFNFAPTYVIIKREQNASGQTIHLFAAKTVGVDTADSVARDDGGNDRLGVSETSNGVWLDGTSLKKRGDVAQYNTNGEEYHVIAFA